MSLEEEMKGIRQELADLKNLVHQLVVKLATQPTSVTFIPIPPAADPLPYPPSASPWIWGPYSITPASNTTPAVITTWNVGGVGVATSQTWPYLMNNVKDGQSFSIASAVLSA